MKETNKSICDVSNSSSFSSNTKYVTVDISNVDNSLISYLKENAKNCLFTDRINDRRGFVYVDYNIFVKAQNIIDDIFMHKPKDLDQLQTARYLYISLGKLVGYDINMVEEKNSFLNFNNISLVNNIWNALITGKASNISLAKLYLYLCSLAKIKCEIIRTSDNYLANKLTIDGNDLMVNLAKDTFYIQANFPTTSFSSYNKDYSLDKKIGYIKDEYNDQIIDKSLSKVDYFSNNVVEQILMRTQNIFEIDKIKPVELGLIYKHIFDKYCPDYDIVINNLYVNEDEKKHFILISHDSLHYSYNYKKHSFTSVSEDDLVTNLADKKLGLYEDEVIPIKNNALSL